MVARHFVDIDRSPCCAFCQMYAACVGRHAISFETGKYLAGDPIVVTTIDLRGGLSRTLCPNAAQRVPDLQVSVYCPH